MSTTPIPKNEQLLLDTSKPADFSFKHMTIIQAMGVEGARSTRIGAVPERGSEKKKLLTKSIWLNNNKLKNIKNLDVLVESLLEIPMELSWIDFSFNYINEIDDCILKYPNLKIVYFHGNCIKDLNQLLKLRRLKSLRTITFHGNPISNMPNYRVSVVGIIPQLLNLDFTPVTRNEKLFQPPTDILKMTREDDAKESKRNKE